MNTAWEHHTYCDAPCLICGQGECMTMAIACDKKKHYCKSCQELLDIGIHWVTYIVLCSDGTLYTGATNNLAKRIKTHNEGKGAKYTRARRPVRIVSYYLCDSKSEAMKLEYKIKQLSHHEKLIFKLI